MKLIDERKSMNLLIGCGCWVDWWGLWLGPSPLAASAFHSKQLIVFHFSLLALSWLIAGLNLLFIEEVKLFEKIKIIQVEWKEREELWAGLETHNQLRRSARKEINFFYWRRGQLSFISSLHSIPQRKESSCACGLWLSLFFQLAEPDEINKPFHFISCFLSFIPFHCWKRERKDYFYKKEIKVEWCRPARINEGKETNLSLQSFS